MVRIATLFAIVAGVLLSAAPASAQTQQARVLVFHPDPAGRPDVSAGVSALTALSRDGGFRVDATSRPTDLTAANLARYRAVAFLNANGDRLNAEQEGALADFVGKRRRLRRHRLLRESPSRAPRSSTT